MAGRKPKEISKKTFEEMLKIQCTQEEVMAVLGCAKLTLQRWMKKTYGEGATYTALADRFGANGRMSLRRSLFQQAKKKPAVAIFLAKNYLGMSDNPEPVPSGEESKEFAKAVNSAVKALSKADLSSMAEIPVSAGSIDTDAEEEQTTT